MPWVPIAGSAARAAPAGGPSASSSPHRTAPTDRPRMAPRMRCPGAAALAGTARRARRATPQTRRFRRPHERYTVQTLRKRTKRAPACLWASARKLGVSVPHSVSLEIGGRPLIIETGELAKQANGSVLIRYGDQNVVLAAVTASEKPREGVDFFPLTCDYEEKMYARYRAVTSSVKAGRPNTGRSARARSIARFGRCSRKASATTCRSSRPCCRSIPNSTTT